jgi:serine/threonine protein kinase
MFFNLGEEIREPVSGPWASGWRVEGFLASGRHFRHYLVRSLLPELAGQRAVLKVIKYDPRRCGDPRYVAGLRDRLRFECETLAHFSPRLPEPVDYFEVPNAQDPFEGFGADKLRAAEPVLVRSMVHGSSLAQLMESHGAPPGDAERLLLCMARTCSFLDALHAGGRGWLFWELSPEHIVVDPEHDYEPSFVGTSNFRMLKEGRATPPPRLREALLPDAGYAAPEALRGEGEPRTDLYAVGALVFHLFSGIDPRVLGDDIRSSGLDPKEHPVAFAQRLRDTIERHCRRSLKGLGVHRARVRRLVLRAMEPDPALRFESGAEMRDEILGLLRRSMPVAWPDQPA